MSDEKYIGYRPEINYESSYDTERGTYYNTTSDNVQTEKEPSSGYDNVIEENMDKIDSLLNGLPSKLKNSILEVYNPIKDTYSKYLKNQLIVRYKSETKFIDNTSHDQNYGLYLNKKVLTMKKGTTKKINAIVVPTSDPTNKVMEWKSSNKDIAIVDDEGNVTALEVGNVVVGAISTYNKYDECIVTVLEDPDEDKDNKKDNTEDKDPNENEDDNKKDNTGDDPSDDGKQDEDFIVHISEVALDRTNIIVKVNQSKQLIATIYPKNATNKTLVWSSNMNNIATVSDGLVTGVTPGKCVITVASVDGNKTDTCFVTVIIDNKNNPDNPNPDGGNDDNENPNPSPNPPPTPNPDDNPSGGDESEDDPDFPTPDPPPVIVIPDDDTTGDDNPYIVPIEFIKNLYDLLEFYTNNLKDMLHKYYKTLLTTTLGKDLNDLNFILNNIKVSNNDIVSSYRHLLDMCLKNEALSNVKVDFLSNNFNFNQTLFHLKGFIVSYELRKKYASESYVKNTDRSNSISNGLLKAVKLDYSKRYDKSYENLFRYLNSSLKITDNVIDNLLQSILAKGILTEKGGI